MITIGLLGCGNIGRVIAKGQENFKITAVFDVVFERAEEFGREFGATPYSDFTAFLKEPTDIIVEAASVSAATAYAEEVLLAGKDIVIMSVGALADVSFREELIMIARENKRKIHIPSGAIMGLDNIRVGQISNVDKFVLRTTKNPKSLSREATEKTCIFTGKAFDCVHQYPKNTNVAESLSIACGREVDVELWMDPNEDRNMHEIFFEGEFGEAYVRVRNVPSPANPATSYLAALSILTLLRNLDNPLVIGA
ncbi:MAG: aspartate dehydrogenase [Methanocorpusculum sp.]|jgi:isopentenyl-diphosphate delta-isomerase/aspartate dehydrogenase|nr:aspartate dehydrogenase [Methanocorpusculum sp.]MDD2470773.1 aspartate dehydrogenase [Methanocorpusculum sp.]MDD3256635.1 aspartate dehydrogenase [Methanocorpusculum sp.]MDD4133395.1 aspartate dehydrogenase [Methanocorpusculum sp.]